MTKTVVTSALGTHGDVQPHVALAVTLKSAASARSSAARRTTSVGICPIPMASSSAALARTCAS